MQHIVKRRGNREPYDARKLYASIYRSALAVREPVATAEIIADETVKYVETWLASKHEVTSSDVRRVAYKHLLTIHYDVAQQYSYDRLRALGYYRVKHKRPKQFNYDAIVIGTGAGGGVTAHQLAQAGKKVAVVEMEKFGGECPNFGCVPTKSLLQSAEIYKIITGSERFGIKAEVDIDYKKIKQWKNLAVKRTGTSEGEDLYEAENIDVYHGHAHFLNPWEIAVGSTRLKAQNFMIATGTKSVVPPIAGLVDTGFITYREAINLTKPPKSLFIIGGGAIGCEFAELFCTFGAKIYIADMAPRLIPQEDPEVGDLLKNLFEKRGAHVYCNTSVTRVEKKGDKKHVSFEHNGNIQNVIVDEILLASGKAPNTDLGLENAGIKYNKNGIQVNNKMQTTAPHIYAAGDVIGPYRFTHMASYQSRIAAHNMLHNKKVTADYHAVPRCVFVDPEIACVGMTEQQLKDKNITYQIGMTPIFVIGRANTTNQKEGFVKVLANKKGKLLGASVVSPRAGEVIHELTLAVQMGLKACDVAKTIHAFPTWSEAVRLACNKIHC